MDGRKKECKIKVKGELFMIGDVFLVINYSYFPVDKNKDEQRLNGFKGNKS